MDRTPRESGFSLIEILLACAIFAMTVTAVVGAITYGNASATSSGNRQQAEMLADEGLQAARNIRDAGYSNLVLGTFGVATTGGVYGLSGASDTTGIFTRTVAVANGGTNRKTVTSTVSWNEAFGGAHSYSASTELTNWLASLKTWPGAIQYGSKALGTCGGYRVDTAGKYAYVIAQGCTPNFYVVDISTPTAPTIVGSTTLTGTLNDVRVSGAHAYVASSDSTKEFQVVDVSTPASPALAGSYNAPGTAAGQAVYISGNWAFLGRAANGGNAEFVVLDVTTPASPAMTYVYANNVSITDVVRLGNYAYLATSSGTILTIDVTSILGLGVLLGQLLTGTYTPPGSGAITALSVYGSNLLVGRGSTFSTAAIGLLGVPYNLGSVSTTGAGTINYIDSTTGFGFLGTSYTAGEFQVVNLATIGTPTIARTVDITGTTSNLTGVAYNGSYDVVVGSSALTTGQAQVFGKN